MKYAFLIIILSALTMGSFSQSTNDLLNLLVSNKTINQEQADSVRAEAALLQQQTEAARKSFPVNTASKMQLSGYAQIRFQAFDEDKKYDAFDIRRARIDLRGNITPYFSCRVQADLSNNPKLIDGYGEIKLADYFSVTAGQFKVPFSQENLTSSNKLESIDRSQVVEALVARGKDVIGNQNGRDIGIKVSGTFLKRNDQPMVEYHIGVFNGSGINVSDTANSSKDIVGRLVITPIRGLSFGGGYYNGWDKAIKPDVAGESQIRNRFGVELSYITNRLSVKGEYITGQDGKTSRAGWYVQAGYYIIAQKMQLVGKYDTYDPNTSSADNVSTNYSIGATCNFNNWSRLQAFYTIRQEEGAAVDNNYFALQYQIGF